jgi:signal transduction histidine kinase/CheY-like chemotaxis protein/HPt (histidine-containing phosphotransfer) domain-containing protein
MSDRNPKKMTDAGWEDLPAALDVAVFEFCPDGRFRPVGNFPGWFVGFGPVRPSDCSFDLAGRFPLLELFITKCGPAWESAGQTRLTSDIWTDVDDRGSEHYLQATAISAGDARLLLLQSLPRDFFTYQQLAHDLELEKEKVERMSRTLTLLNRELDIKCLEAERATRAKSDFLAAMSHEIRTPLHAIIGVGDVLAGTALTPEQRKCVEVSQRNGIGLLQLINDILDLSKVESGKIELEQACFDLRDLIARALEVIEIRATAKGLALRQTIAPGVPFFLTGDAQRLRQVIINLLGNSLKFTDRGSLEVWVEADPEDRRPGCLRFVITDTGIGIPEDKLDLVFESFTQADSSTTRRYGGTGLGLAISKQLVELMGGRIWVESRVGSGSSFFFTVKLEVNAGMTEPAFTGAPVTVTAMAGPPAPSCDLRILMVDDTEDNRFLLLSYLRELTCSVDIAENGLMAVEKFRSGQYELVLMDIEMPDMDGYAATRAIRALERERGCRPAAIIALTAHAFADMAAKSAEAGFSAHLTKPIRKAALLEALAKYAGDHSRPASAGPATAVASAAASGRIRIPVEAGMEDLVPGYLDKRRAEIAKYRQALIEEDFETIRILGHKMKGTGAGYGFEELTSLGGQIEKAANNRDAARVRMSVDALASYVQNVELEFSR